MKKHAFVDLVIVGVVFWATWALRYVGVANIGVWTMLAAGGAAAVIIVIRKEDWRNYGFRMPPSLSWTFARAAEFAFLTFLIGAGLLTLITVFGLTPTQSVVLSDQPDVLAYFLIDLIVGAWLAAGVGEEFFFRGFLLTRFQQAFGGGRIALAAAVIAQAIWFGAGHASQGAGGVIAITLLAVFLGVYYITRGRRIIWPLMLGHAFVDTVSLTINYVNQ